MHLTMTMAVMVGKVNGKYVLNYQDSFSLTALLILIGKLRTFVRVVLQAAISELRKAKLYVNTLYTSVSTLSAGG